MKIAIGSDHAGFDMKEHLCKYLSDKGIQISDFGAYSVESVDYPDTGFAVADNVADGVSDLGVLVCGSGIGMSIVANKVKGIRAALCHNEEYARLSRQHNNANILVLGGRFLSQSEAEKIVDAWLTTPFSQDPRHQKRIDKIER